MPKAFTTGKPEIVSCRISEMSRQRRSGRLAARPDVPPEADERVERRRHSDQRQQGQAPVLDEEDGHQPQHGEALLQEVARHLRDRVLDLLHVRRDVAHHRARAVAPEEREGLVQDVFVEAVAQVGDGALPGVGHQGRGQVRAHALEEVEAEDGERDRPDVEGPDEDVVENGLDHVDEPGAAGGVTRGRDPGQEEKAAIGPREREQPAVLRGIFAEDRPSPSSADEPKRNFSTAGFAGPAEGSRPAWRVGL
jgi:hypothetical protein